MTIIETIQMIWFFVNPFNFTGGGWLVVFDIFTFIFIPYIIFKKFYKKVLRRVILFYVGFIMTQITTYYNPTLEYVLEVGGILLILYAALGRENERMGNENRGDH